MDSEYIIGPSDKSILQYLQIGHLTFFEIFPNNITDLTVFATVGKERCMCTFTLKRNSQSFQKFGEYVTGVVFYDIDERQDLEKRIILKQAHDCDVLKVAVFELERSSEDIEILKYEGLKVCDIISINFLPSKEDAKYIDADYKELPNIITIPIDSNGMDVDRIWFNLLFRRIINKEKLHPFELEELISLSLVLYEGKIHRLIFDASNQANIKFENNINILSRYYKIKRRRLGLSTNEEIAREEVCEIQTKRIHDLISGEIKKAGMNKITSLEVTSKVAAIFDHLDKFNPAILHYSSLNIYWDTDSYLHIIIRHYKLFQIGSFEQKSTIPYVIEDLRKLIGKVLHQVGVEIKAHFNRYKNKEFRRSGKWSIPFNGDYFCILINGDGKLVTFYRKTIA